MLRMTLFLLLAVLLPAPLAAQMAGPSFGLGYGVTQSRLRTGGAMSVEAGTRLGQWQRLELHADLLYQWGTASGRGCERLADRYCLGGTDRNQILGAGATLRLPVATLGPVEVSLPLGVGLYHRRSSTTESEGPIEWCVEGNQVVSCPGNPPFGSVSYRTDATAPGYSLGLGLHSRVGSVGAYLEVRVHDVLERDGRAGALPVSAGVRF